MEKYHYHHWNLWGYVKDMKITIHTIKNTKTIKAMVKFRMKHGHKPLPTKIWERIAFEIGGVDALISYVVVGNCDDGIVFVVEGAGTAEQVVKLPLNTIAKFPQDLQDIIFEARKTGEYNKISTIRDGAINMETGEVFMWKIGEF